jgi:hypothetical protein
MINGGKICRRQLDCETRSYWECLSRYCSPSVDSKTAPDFLGGLDDLCVET